MEFVQRGGKLEILHKGTGQSGRIGVFRILRFRYPLEWRLNGHQLSLGFALACAYHKNPSHSVSNGSKRRLDPRMIKLHTGYDVIKYKNRTRASPLLHESKSSSNRQVRPGEGFLTAPDFDKEPSRFHNPFVL